MEVRSIYYGNTCRAVYSGKGGLRMKTVVIIVPCAEDFVYVEYASNVLCICGGVFHTRSNKSCATIPTDIAMHYYSGGHISFYITPCLFTEAVYARVHGNHCTPINLTEVTTRF